jgi:hypothetical protein
MPFEFSTPPFMVDDSVIMMTCKGSHQRFNAASHACMADVQKHHALIRSPLQKPSQRAATKNLGGSTSTPPSRDNYSKGSLCNPARTTTAANTSPPSSITATLPQPPPPSQPPPCPPNPPPRSPLPRSLSSRPPKSPWRRMTSSRTSPPRVRTFPQPSRTYPPPLSSSH